MKQTANLNETSEHELSRPAKKTLSKHSNTKSVSYRTMCRWAERDAFNHELLHQQLQWSSSSSDTSKISSSNGHPSTTLHESSQCSEESATSNMSESTRVSENRFNSDVCVQPQLSTEQFCLESDDDEENFHVYLDISNSKKRALHKYTEITVDEAVLNFMQSFISNTKSYNCLEDDLKVLHSMLPKQNNMPRSVYKLLKFVNEVGPPCKTIMHYCCKICQFYLGINPVELCPACNADGGCIEFYELSIIDQIRYLFEHKNLGQLLKKAATNRNSDPYIIADITDGSEYKRVNINTSAMDLTLILSTDGAVVKHSSKANLWPVSFMIAELPPTLRHSFIICAGIWYANTKPEMNTFLMPFCVALNDSFKNQVFNWLDPQTLESFQTRVTAPLIVADAPARALILNMQNHNGKHGCKTCEIKTTKTQTVVGERRRRVYKFRQQGWILRTKPRMSVFGKEAEASHSVIKGVKGRSVVNLLPGADQSTVVFAEFMHVVCLGVIKQVVTLWVSKPGPWSLRTSLQDIDKRLVNTKPPDLFCRLPRALSDYKFWKASEFLYWAEFYSLLIVRDFLPDRYYQHWMLFVLAVNILLQSKIKIIPDLDQVENLLKLFVRDFEFLYGEKELTYNLHQMVHLRLHKERWGPLWGISAFPFEDFIGTLGATIHGTKEIGKELINKTKLCQGVECLRGQIRLNNFFKHNNDRCLGKCVTPNLLPYEAYLFELVGVSSKDLTVHTRAQLKGGIYTSKLYKVIRTLNYCIWCKISERELIGTIKFFAKCSEEIYMLIDPFSIDQERIVFHGRTRTQVEHIVPVKDGGPSVLINLKDVCVVTNEDVIIAGRLCL